MKDVTVIIPSFVTNDEQLTWLEEAITSAMSQGCNVVVYDDGSPYPVNSKLKLAWRLSTRFRFVEGKENHGVSYARNRAVEKVETSLFIPLDCDDKFAEGAIDKLLAIWTGIPVYPDVSKFGTEVVLHYRLLDFDCEMLKQKLGTAPVNVLQSVEQWRSVGCWNEKIDLYEDAEYNARLLGTFCGKNYHEPLVLYRQHGSQRTRRHTDVSPHIRQSILEMVRRYDFMCQSCGGGRRSQIAKQNAFSSNISDVRSLQSRLAEMPGSQGEAVLAHYIGGKGQGYHYYKGPVTHFPYKVMFDDLIYVDNRDTSESESTNRRSLLIRVHKDEEKHEVVEAVVDPGEVIVAPADMVIADVPVPESANFGELVERVPVVRVEKHPVVEPDIIELAEQAFEEEVAAEPVAPVTAEQEVQDLPDISNMSVKEIRNLDMESEMAAKLLKIEMEGLNRDRVVKWLESRA
jgi:glycosyltransferase involved in cell wall biosynthesis